MKKKVKEYAEAIMIAILIALFIEPLSFRPLKYLLAPWSGHCWWAIIS